tara:strand:- start:1173 stop:1409 length:237 start_codon:yes stop_codon:yes gene_type:complete
MKKNIVKIVILAQISCVGLTKNTKIPDNNAVIEQSYEMLKLKQALYASTITIEEYDSLEVIIKDSDVEFDLNMYLEKQ